MIDRILLESVSAAFRSLLASPGRTVLTSLGVAIGVTATITVVSIIAGFNTQINERFEGFGANSVTIQPKNSFEDQLKGRIAYLRYEELDLVARRVHGISNITPEMSVFGQFRGTVQYKGKSTITDVKGTASSWQNLLRTYPEKGRFLVASDDEARRRVAVIGPSVAKQLKMPDNPIGEYIQVGSGWAKVVGVLERRGKSFGVDQDDLVLMPFSTGRAMSSRERDPSFWIQLEVDDPARMSDTIERIRQLLRQSRGIADDEEEDFEVQTSTQFMDAFNEMSLSISLISGGIMAISMLVGGIGIMNMMLVSVAERTREIGILKALGATRNWIVVMFLSEAVMMALAGCLLGLLLSTVAIMGVGLIPGFPPPSTPLWAIGLSMGFCVLIGGSFGVIPAVKAANMEPIEAMRRS
ncbi:MULTISPECIES: ABC transporter permease [unclassified Stenotrophomonas]|uniref:ABC transporter permease n=1 Tax=unclassified Stenotrophomonas TaxID=196198 RepID=UPI002117D318|nr:MULTISPECIES: ABC transporter permease [unclassified Stenotrophomonas]